MAFCAACSGSASPDAGEKGEAAQGKKVAGGEADRLLGAVNLPKPDWLPKGFPLPDDAHIYIVTKPNVTLQSAQGPVIVRCGWCCPPCLLSSSVHS